MFNKRFFISWAIAGAFVSQSPLLAAQASYSADYVVDLKNEWQFVKEDRGITAYNQFSDELGYNAVRLEMVVDQPIYNVLSFTTEPDRFPQWMESIAEVKVLEKPDWFNYLLYVTYDFPFPYQNRDSISRTQVFKRDDGSIILEYQREIAGKAESDDFIRMDYISGSWELYPLEGDKTRIVNTSLVSPGGEGPKWVINAFSMDVPFTSMENLLDSIDGYQPRSISMEELPSK